MTNKLKSPESGVSRRGILQAGGILATLVTLEGCAGAGSNETQQSGTSENEPTESKEDTKKLKVNKEDFEGWETKTPE